MGFKPSTSGMPSKRCTIRPRLSHVFYFVSQLFYVGWFLFKFHKIVIMTSFKFSPNTCPYLKFYCTYKLRTLNTQQHTVHLIIKMKMTLTGDEGLKRRSKVAKNEQLVISRKVLHSQTSYVMCFILLRDIRGISVYFEKNEKEQEAFRERKHLHICDLWPWP